MCYRPINVKQADGRYMKVKCGKCLECLTEKRNAWVIRMEEELKSAHGKGVFFTLTYGDNSVPKNFLVYEADSNVPKLYESYSDYAYTTPVGFRGKKSVAQPVDSVLQEFYKDYTITDFNIDNNYKKYKYDYEEISRLCMDEDASRDGAVDDWLTDNYFDDDDDLTYAYSGGSVYDLNNCSFEDALKTFDRDEYTRITGEDTDFQGETTSQDLQQVQEGAVDRPIGSFRQGDISSQSVRPRDTREGESSGQRCKCKPHLVLSFNSVRQKDLQDWLKRGREKLRRNGKTFTYFITSEYGPRTLRPHYHGCFFGVSLDDVRFMFQDWHQHFGDPMTRNRPYKAENMTSNGGCSYCGKYCAKGFYEHPLCSKDFFYLKSNVQTGNDALDKLMNRLEFTEYHSKHYERCLEYFGIDKPIVTPTFKLVSKGLGIGYISRTKDYFRLDEAEAEMKISVLKHSDDYDRVFTETMEDIKRFFHYTSQKGYTYTMPQYYSKKMFSDNLRHAFANYVRSQYDKLYFTKLESLRAQDPTRKDVEILSMLEDEERRTHLHRLESKQEMTQRFLEKSKL